MSKRHAERSEAQIQAACVKVLKQLGFQTYSLSQYRPSQQSPGVADVFACGHGVTAWLEFKRPGQRQTLEQMDFELDVIMNNGTYVVLHSTEEVIRWVESLLRVARGWSSLRRPLMSEPSASSSS